MDFNKNLAQEPDIEEGEPLQPESWTDALNIPNCMNCKLQILEVIGFKPNNTSTELITRCTKCGHINNFIFKCPEPVNEIKTKSRPSYTG